MKVAVRYCSRTGNTQKVAQAIAAALGTEAADVSTPLEENTEALFLGSAVYAAGVDDSIKAFLQTEADKIGTLYCFSTAAVLASTYKQVKKLAQEQGIAVADEEFHCRGAFAFLHKDRPNEADLKNAADFALVALAKVE